MPNTKNAAPAGIRGGAGGSDENRHRDFTALRVVGGPLDQEIEAAMDRHPAGKRKNVTPDCLGCSTEARIRRPLASFHHYCPRGDLVRETLANDYRTFAQLGFFDYVRPLMPHETADFLLDAARRGKDLTAADLDGGCFDASGSEDGAMTYRYRTGAGTRLGGDFTVSAENGAAWLGGGA